MVTWVVERQEKMENLRFTGAEYRRLSLGDPPPHLSVISQVTPVSWVVTDMLLFVVCVCVCMLVCVRACVIAQWNESTDRSWLSPPGHRKQCQ